MERIVAPADCALAIAIPLGFEEFCRDLTANDKDFARSVVASSGRTAEQAWAQLYQPKIVELTTRVAERSQAMGATVVTGVTGAVLAGLLERFAVVTVLAHATQPPVRPGDLRAPRAIVEAIARGTSPVASHLRSVFASERWATDEDALCTQLAGCLDAALQVTRAWTGATSRVELGERPAFHLDRIMLEDCFGSAMRPGPVLELDDGLRTMDELFATIPPRFAGVLDLSVCNSVTLGESIKRRLDAAARQRGAERPDCLVVGNTFLARADLRLVRFALVIGRLAHKPARYTDALTEVSRHILTS